MFFGTTAQTWRAHDQEDDKRARERACKDQRDAL
jgi:hypothetical protein